MDCLIIGDFLRHRVDDLIKGIPSDTEGGWSYSRGFPQTQGGCSYNREIPSDTGWVFL